MTKGKSIVVAEASDLQAYDVVAEGVDAIRSIIQANVGDMSNLNEFSLPRAINGSGSSNRFEIPGLGDESEMVSEIEGIIVFHTPARAYFEKSYEETGGGEQPDCRSNDGIHGVGDPGGLCPKCQLAQFTKNSDGTTERPRCDLMKRLFILRPGEIMPTMFNAKAGNVGQCERYMFNLSVKGRLKFNHCITKLTVSKDKYKNGRDWMKWNFSMLSKLPGEICQQMDAFHEFLGPIVRDIEITADEVADGNDPEW